MSLNESPQKLYNVGLNYKKADINVRGAFSITKENQILLLKEAKENENAINEFNKIIDGNNSVEFIKGNTK